MRDSIGVSALLIAGTLALTLPAANYPDSAIPEGPRGETIVVRMVDISATEFKFEPAEITVRPGDVVQFVQAGAMPHNVQFKDGPAGSDLSSLLMGPFLTQPGETYDVVIDERFTAGSHPFVCTPHELMGMKGTLTVEGS
jgi:plastocyanin